MHYSLTMIITAALIFIVGMWIIRKLFFVLLIVGVGLLLMHYYGYDVVRSWVNFY